MGRGKEEVREKFRPETKSVRKMKGIARLLFYASQLLKAFKTLFPESSELLSL